MNGIKHLLSRLSLFLVFMLAFSTACKDDFNSSIPYVNVNFSINTVNHNGLNTVGFPVFSMEAMEVLPSLTTGYRSMRTILPVLTKLISTAESKQTALLVPVPVVKHNIIYWMEVMLLADHRPNLLNSIG